MIYGVGTDISEVIRFNKWIDNPSMIQRYFSSSEILNISETLGKGKILQHYAARFSAKEAFSKALGTGIRGFSLKEVFVQKDENGKPFIKLEGNAEKIFRERCGNSASIHLSISHEKDYAVAFVVIEII